MGTAVLDIIIKIGGALTAAGAIGLVIDKLIKRVNERKDIKKRLAAIEAKEEKDRKAIQSENALIIRGLSACLDGLGQLGANHTVPSMKKEIDDFLISRAHD